MDDKAAAELQALASEVIPLLQDGLTMDAFLAMSNDDAMELINLRNLQITALIGAGTPAEAAHAMTAPERAAAIPPVPEASDALKALAGIATIDAPQPAAPVVSVDPTPVASVDPAPAAPVAQPQPDAAPVVDPTPAQTADAPAATVDAQTAPQDAPKPPENASDQVASAPVADAPAPVVPVADPAPVAADPAPAAQDPAPAAPPVDIAPVAPQPDAPAAPVPDATEEPISFIVTDDPQPTREQLLGSIGMFYQASGLIITELAREARDASNTPDQADHAAFSRVQTAFAEFRNALASAAPDLPDDFKTRILGS